MKKKKDTYLFKEERYKISEAELEGINAGLADIEAGRVDTNEYA